MNGINLLCNFVLSYVVMKKIFYVFAVFAVLLVAGNMKAETLVSCLDFSNETLSIGDDGHDVDMYLDCFENAVKLKDMELAAKIANVLYGMNMNESQAKRFTKIENKISKKNYRVYRDNLRFFASKSSTFQDDVDVYEYEDDGSSFVDDIVGSFSGFFNDLGAVDTSQWHYERHDTLDGGGFVDVFVDTFGKFLFDDAENSAKGIAADGTDIDALLDEFEKYVNMSADALRSVISGAEESLKDFEKYSRKASSVSDQISRKSNAMSSTQFKRYLHILGNMVTGMF